MGLLKKCTYPIIKKDLLINLKPFLKTMNCSSDWTCCLPLHTKTSGLWGSFIIKPR